MQSSSPEFMLHKLIGRYGFHGDAIDGIIEAMQGRERGVGKIWKSNKYMLCIDREQLIITPLYQIENSQQERSFRIPEEGNYNLANNIKISIKRYQRSAGFKPSRASLCITLDADQVRFPLTYRRTETGDHFRPFGMKGSKLVSDYLTDQKRSYVQKMEQHVLTDKQGGIIWLIGERTSDLTKVTEQTKNILEITFSKE